MEKGPEGPEMVPAILILLGAGAASGGQGLGRPSAQVSSSSSSSSWDSLAFGPELQTLFGSSSSWAVDPAFVTS